MLRLVLVLALCVSTSAHDSVTNLCSAFTPSELQTPHVWYSGHNEVWCGNTPGEVSSAWSASIHSSVTRACAADIELNPGPGPTTTQPTGTTTRTTRQSKLSTTGDIGIDQGATSSSQHAQPTLADLMQEMKKMRGDFNSFSKRIDKKVDGIKQDVTHVREDCFSMKKSIDNLQKENTNLKRQLDNVEGQSRRSNIIIRGLPEGRGETWDDCDRLVRDTLVADLKMSREDADKLHIERAHRLPQRRTGTRRGGGGRDIIFKPSFFQDKVIIMKKAKKIRPAGIFFMDDLTQPVRLARAKLKDKLTQAREAGYVAFLSHDKLVVLNGDKRNVYVYREDSDTVQQLYKNFDDDQAAGADDDRETSSNTGGSETNPDDHETSSDHGT